MTSVFFYGLFMDEELLRANGLEPRNVRLAHVSGYGLRIGERATLVRSAKEEVFGYAMDLSEAELGALYGERSVADYVPEAVVAVDGNGNAFNATSYILPAEKLVGSNRDYAGSLARVAQKLGLPPRYVSEIEQWMD